LLILDNSLARDNGWVKKAHATVPGRAALHPEHGSVRAGVADADAAADEALLRQARPPDWW
jgi:hypothetical protein